MVNGGWIMGDYIHYPSFCVSRGAAGWFCFERLLLTLMALHPWHNGNQYGS